MNNLFMPRYGTIEYRRLGLIMLMIGLAALCLLIPELANAQSAGTFSGDFGPDKDLVTNVDKSLLGWWKVAAVWGLWLSLAALFISVVFFGGRFWWVPLAAAFICLFGETFVNGAKNLMG